MRQVSLKTWVVALCAAYLCGYLTRPIVVQSVEFLRRFRQAWREASFDRFAENVSDHLHDQQDEGAKS